MKNVLNLLVMLMLGVAVAGLAGCAFRAPTTPMLPAGTSGGQGPHSEGGSITGMVSGVLDTDTVTITVFPIDANARGSYVAIITGNGDYVISDIPPGTYMAQALVHRHDLVIDQSTYGDQIIITDALETIDNVDFAF